MPKKILLADDEYDIRFMLEQLLKLEGFEVQTVANGREALGVLEKEDFDLLILDNIYKHYPWSFGYDPLGESVLAKGIEYSPFVDTGGNPRFTVFFVTVKNGRKDKIGLDMLDAILVDDQRREYKAISADDPSILPRLCPPWGPAIRSMMFAERVAAIFCWIYRGGKFTGRLRRMERLIRGTEAPVLTASI